MTPNWLGIQQTIAHLNGVRSSTFFPKGDAFGICSGLPKNEGEAQDKTIKLLPLDDDYGNSWYSNEKFSLVTTSEEKKQQSSES